MYFYDRAMYDQALAALDSALSIDPLYATAHYQKGRTHRVLAQHESAVASFQQALPRSDQFTRTPWEWRPPAPDNQPNATADAISWRFAPDGSTAFALIPNETHTRGQIHALDLSKRTVVWSQTVPVAHLNRASVLVHDNTLYVTTGSPGVIGHPVRPESWDTMSGPVPCVLAVCGRTTRSMPAYFPGCRLSWTNGRSVTAPQM